MRLFIAAPIPAGPAFSAATERLRHDYLQARPVQHGTWHVTLRFLGEMDDPLPVAEAMRHAVAELPAIPARLRGVGAFPRPRAARIAWVAVEAPELAALAYHIRDCTKHLGQPPDAGDFVPHVTLARLPTASDLTSWIAQFTNTVFFDDMLRKVVLFRSDLTKQGAAYRELSNAPLGFRGNGQIE